MSADLRNGVLGALQLVKRAIGHAYDVFVRLFHESLFQGGNGRARLRELPDRSASDRVWCRG